MRYPTDKCRVISPGKRRFFLIPFFLLLFFSALPGGMAQERGLDLALGLEGNMNTTSGVSGAGWFSGLGNLGSFAAGVKAGYSYDFSAIATLEMAALGRWYFLSFEHSRLFAQLEAGAALIFYQEDTTPAFLGGLGLGWRFQLGRWYLEPALRAGYPFIWGGGLGFGLRI
jgi:hypothetical protein